MRFKNGFAVELKLLFLVNCCYNIFNKKLKQCLQDQTW